MESERLTGQPGSQDGSDSPQSNPANGSTIQGGVVIRKEDFSREGAFTVYKRGQGFNVRMGTGVAIGVVVLLAARWIIIQFESYLNAWYDWAIMLTGLGIILFGGGFIIYRVTLKSPRFVNFFINTELEMRKVTWPSRKDLKRNTQVIIGLTLTMAVFFFLADLLFMNLSRLLGLQG